METSFTMRYLFYCLKQQRFEWTVEKVQQVRNWKRVHWNRPRVWHRPPRPKTPEIPCCRQNIPTYLLLINRKISTAPSVRLLGCMGTGGGGSLWKAEGSDHPITPSLLQDKNSHQQTIISLALGYLRKTLRITATTAFSSSFMQNRCQGSEHHEKSGENSFHMKNWAIRFARPKMMMKTWKTNLGHVRRSSWWREMI